MQLGLTEVDVENLLLQVSAVIWTEKLVPCIAIEMQRQLICILSNPALKPIRLRRPA